MRHSFLGTAKSADNPSHQDDAIDANAFGFFCVIITSPA